MHRDLQPSNMSSQAPASGGPGMTVKIGDLGMACWLPGRCVASTHSHIDGAPASGGPLTAEVTSLWCRAPEVLLMSEEYGVEVDMWAVGCICVELVAKKIAFPGSSESSMINKIIRSTGTESSTLGALRFNPFFLQCNFKPMLKPRQPPMECGRPPC